MLSQKLIEERRYSLAQRVRSGLMTVAPGVYDGLSARVADQLGFAALYMTGYGVSISAAGKPDAGLATYDAFVGRVRVICECTRTPLIADADTGFGGALNVAQTIQGYERAGAAAIQIEDQVFPKRCGHTLGREVVPAAEMVLKIRVAVDAREDPNFLIIARTDARTQHGLDEALRRGEAYLKAGADVLFVESPESVQELERIGKTFSSAALLANMVPGGRTPILSAADLSTLGYRIIIHPGACLAPAVTAMSKFLEHLLATGHVAGAPVPAADFTKLHGVVGFEDVWNFDAKYKAP